MRRYARVVISVPVRKLAVVAAVIAAALTAVPAAGAATVRNYDLGVVNLPDPGPKGPIPVRLWGAIGIPSGPGPHPLVIVAHGRHGDNCPPTAGDGIKWPCFAREARNDLGLRHVVRALASRGVAAISPDLNGAYTVGWGEPTDEPRWRRIVNRTLSEVEADVEGGGNRFGLRLGDRINLRRLGMLGHSRSGHNGARLARTGRIDSMLLLAPIHEGVPLRDIPTTVVLSRCDGDVGGQGRRYFRRAESANRDKPVFLIRLGGANHNFYNRLLARQGRDDGTFAGVPGCRKAERLGPKAQQGWLDRVAANFFAATLDGAERPGWMRARRPAPGLLHGLGVAIERLFP
jgi:dienelactone hydrolase